MTFKNKYLKYKTKYLNLKNNNNNNENDNDNDTETEEITIENILSKLFKYNLNTVKNLQGGRKSNSSSLTSSLEELFKSSDEDSSDS